jgi:hypothetical protein
MTSGIKGDTMTDKDKEATDKLNRWLEDIGLAEDKECDENVCELIKEQHDHD